jgi:transcriptional regulator with XRE-family HTH domain/SAM-dependent methyltransferase
MSMMPILAQNLQRFRELRGLTLSGLSQSCGVAKSTLSQLEQGQGNPTVETLWAIANTLEVPFGVLVSVASNDDMARNADLSGNGVNVRFIERTTGEPEIEIYTVEIESGHLKSSAPHPLGVVEKVVVIHGEMLVGDAVRPKLLRAGESHTFEADIAHVYGASHGPAKAMVFIEYPRRGYAGNDATVVLDWPKSVNDWESVCSVVNRLLIEVSNGIAAGLLRFRGCTATARTVRQDLRAKVLTQSLLFSWPLHTIAGVDRQGAYLAILPLRFTDAFSHSIGHSKRGDLPIMVDAARLSRLAEVPFVTLPNSEQLQKTVANSSWILAPLASEVALQRGAMLLPGQLHHLTQREMKPLQVNDDEAFSSRINVEHYDAFELLHPAYARQVVAMAQDILEFSESIDSFHAIDIGTGTGVPLLMLHELLPNLQVLAVEPDDTAFACLAENTRGIDGIKGHHGGFLDLNIPPGQAPLLTSVGASHHFNTAFMLQKSMSLLQPGGVLSVADEFLPEFHTQEERHLALVRHHSAYILTTMAWIERSGLVEADNEDGLFYEAFQQALALASIDAERGNSVQAVKGCRDLYASIRQSTLSKQPGHILGNYTRFFWLELQAMVAGFDYEVERKTYARRFTDLAYMAGFELLRHRRVFATTGADKWGGGTHVLTFRKPCY